jgi:hypothetical protein
MITKNVCNIIEEIEQTGRTILDTSAMKIVSKEGVGTCIFNKVDSTVSIRFS